MKENTFYIETYGCVSNKADSLIMSDILTRSGLTKSGLDEAQFIIINTCAVKEQTENKIKQRLKQLQDAFGNIPEKHVVIAGCLPHVASGYEKKIKQIVPSFSAIIDLNNINELPDILKILKTGAKNQVFLAKESIDKAEILIKIPPGKITGIVPISEGCLGSCTYCCVKNARGRLNCYNPVGIVKNVRYQLAQGVKQVYLTSQDCSTYQYNKVRLVDLVREITSIEKEFFLRLGMINPNFLINNAVQLETIFTMDNTYQFLHVPVQSGSNSVLKTMQRPYLISDIVDPLERLRKRFPNLSISTDVICGFPGETEYDFYKTINFVKWLKPEILNVSKFTPRPGTKAKLMKQVDGKTIKERSVRMSNVFRMNLERINEKWINWSGKVLLLHEGQNKNQAFGRNFAYKNVFVDNYSGKFGTFVQVKIDNIDGFNLHGSII
ncbi:MAG: tRNA (N(6)-L-threonylcarbamoyladenosine(37)-C(2))-methylthiotransferase [Promethearchaeota archaeon]